MWVAFFQNTESLSPHVWYFPVIKIEYIKQRSENKMEIQSDHKATIKQSECGKIII